MTEYCRNGHERTAETTLTEIMPDGRKRRRCRICRQLRLDEKRKQNTAPMVAGRYVEDNTGPSYDDLEPGKQAIVDRFHQELDKLGSPCIGNPEPYTDYVGDSPETTPAPSFAESLCAGCPVRTLCKATALVTRPAWGVWGGTTFAWGNEIYDGTDDPRRYH